MKKIMYILLLLLILVISIAPYSYAAQQQKSGVTSIISDGESFISRGQSGDVYSNYNQDFIDESIGDLAGVLYILGTIVAIIATIVLGIKYITASSSENKAAVKKNAIVVGVGVFILFASVTIWEIVIKSLSQAT